MKSRGFTLLELVIVLALISISSLVGFRFISNMAHSHVSAAERGQALSGARFAIERLRRELSHAYSPSIYVSSNAAGQALRCLSFVPVIAAGSYAGEVHGSNVTPNAIFTWPIEPHSTDLDARYLAINAPSAAAGTGVPWNKYPSHSDNELDNVALLDENIILDGSGGSNTFAETFASPPTFSFVGNKERYTLLKAEKITYCLTAGELKRTRTIASTSSESLMLTGLAATTNHVFGDYIQQSQLLTVDFILTTKDGDLVLSSQLQVGYEP